MKLAFSTIGCPGWSWDEIFATAKDLGLDGIEIRGIENEMNAPAIRNFNSEQMKATMERVRKAGMQISMLTSGACLGVAQAEQNMEEARQYIDLAHRLEVPFVRVLCIVTPEPGPCDLEQAKDLYTQLCAYAKGKGVQVLIETNGPLADSRRLAQFLEGADVETAGVLWDIHHPYRFFGETPQETYRNIGKWVRYTHVKDSVRSDGKVVYRMMGYGDVPVFDTLKVLSDNGYDGFVSLEWVKRWCPELQEPGIVFSHFVSYMNFLMNQL